MAFITHVLGVGSDLPGLYGSTDTYYGTVEQQGRLTLHMHMLVWIKSALSPQQIWDKLTAPDDAFQKALVSYLKAAHIGEFLTGTLAEMKSLPLPLFAMIVRYQIAPNAHCTANGARTTSTLLTI
ncbi:hypothetical protein B0H10DRAFT_2222723 [Mycena sp. CBHHK59/15]|nr:hypothetical protein B0H10DRAFT_2222723 [Mycena sp. CBHHK59/15]